MTEEEFQVASSSKRGSSNNYKRVYIGNLPNQFDNRQSLQDALEKFIQEQIPNVSIELLEVNMPGRAKFPHAVLDCGAQANQVIRSLHQQTWHGQRLNVQREKRNSNNSNNNSSNSNKTKKPGFGGKSWSAPTAPPAAPAEEAEHSIPTLFTPIPVDQAARDIQSVVEEEFKQAEEVGNDPIDVALASTAAATLLAAMNAFAGEDTRDGQTEEESFQDTEPTNWELKTVVNNDDDEFFNDEEPVDEPDNFQMKPMEDLLAEFGKADPDWQSKKVDSPTADATSDENAPASQLAPKGKAPIHICLTSFGFSKGAPKRMDGWSHQQPLLPLDCRDYAAVPNYLAWQDGLSGAVKRAFQYPRDNGDGSEKRFLRDFARKTVAQEVWTALLEAQNEGGYGYASPLEMTIYVGSDTGRHRSVVACEWAATQLRKLLRANAGHAVHQPVSVSTFHRDVETHRQQHYNLKTNNKQKHGNNDGGGQHGKSLKKKQMEFAGDW